MRSFPFTADVYFSLFETYNGTIWPAQLVAYGLGIVALFLALRPLAAGGRIALAILSVFWLWNGIAYHLMHFLQINFAALGFAALFALQGVAVRRDARSAAVGSFRFRADVFGWSGLLLCLFALVVYPLLGWLAGHGWPRAAMFGVAPAPTDDLHVRRAPDAGGRRAALSVRHPSAVVAGRLAAPRCSCSAFPRTGRCCSRASSASACSSGSADSSRKSRSELRNTSHLKKEVSCLAPSLMAAPASSCWGPVMGSFGPGRSIWTEHNRGRSGAGYH